MADEMELNPTWAYVADTVMGGVSQGQAAQVVIDGRAATQLTGRVSLDNNGGFIQIAFDLAEGAAVDASTYTGVEIEVIGNGHAYDLRLRTEALTRPWQSFRTQFTAPPTWTTLRLPFASFEAHRTQATFDPAQIKRIGILAIGREMQADVAVAAVRFYR